MVHFVGAGPGAEDLITVRGLRLLEQADVVIYAGSLINHKLLDYTKESCECHDSAVMTLDQILTVMEEAEGRGLMTVRLHSGDPAIYGAVREQMDGLKERGIKFVMCPGVSSMAGAAAALQLEYTLPGVSQSMIVTRVQGHTKVPEKERLVSLAEHHATMVIFLSSALAEQVKEQLIAGGYREDTPAAVVYKATWPEEKVLRTTLGKLPTDMEKWEISRTALIIVGDVLGDVYEKSRLYDPAYATGYRERKTE